MTGRPPALFPLFAGLETLPGIGPKTARLLEATGITRPRDLLYTLPHSGIRRQNVETVQGVMPPAVVTVKVEVVQHLKPTSRGRPTRVEVQDAATRFFLIFFHARGDWLSKLLPVGETRIISGKVEHFDGVAQITHPDHIMTLEDAKLEPVSAFEPVYPLTQGVAQKQMQKATASALQRCPDLAEWIDPTLKAQQNWPDWGMALAQAHGPESGAELAAEWPARQRLAYDEVFAHQMTLALARLTRRRRRGRSSVGTGRVKDKVLQALPYRPTGAQNRAMVEIAADLASDRRMNRLLQGDVGAGKTLVALMAMLTVVEAGGQAVLMAPTEVLARQHAVSLTAMLAETGVRLDVLTGRDIGADRARKLHALATGEIDVLLGTHAVFQDDVVFHDLRLAIIDEQHRFGVRERMRLGQKGASVDVLVMTATPIPRSLSLTHYGDMDITILDEKPPGRTPVRTAMIAAPRLEEVLTHLDRALAEGRQVYWVCPLVEESETLPLTAAEDRFTHLRARFGDGVVALVHGQMPHSDKDLAMARFVAGDARILVATTVIEVGVDVPNASIMVIEGAERFGLAQLHQLRGRVGRGAAASFCLLMYTPPLGETAAKRLTLLRDTEDGFRLSEADLAMRGAGDMLGTAQSGLPRFRVADLERQAGLMDLARSDARVLLERDPTLASPRGAAVRMLLWLMGQDEALRLLSVG